jgi:hypothetical protein
MELLVTMLRIFPFNPVTALIIALFFASGALNKRRTSTNRVTLAVAALIWAVYAVWDYYMLTWRSPTGDMAIRVDLVFWVPLLLIAATVGTIAFVSGYRTISSPR